LKKIKEPAIAKKHRQILTGDFFMSKNLIILTISIVVAISISIGVYISVSANSEPEWKKTEAQEKEVGVNRKNVLELP
jgi:flagellar basal body-associated protein FliL